MRLLPLILLLAGCLHNQAATATLSRKVTTSNVRVAQLEAEVATTEARLAQLEEAMRAQGAEEVTRLETIEEVNTEVSRIRGEIEVLQFEVSELRKTLDELVLAQERRFLHQEQRLDQIEEFLGVEPPPPPTDEELGLGEGDTGETTLPRPEGYDGPDVVVPDQGDTGDTAERQVPEDAAGKLELAAEHMKEDRNAVARAILERAVEEHAGAPEMAEIRYRIAETYFNEEKWSKAISEFNKVIEGFPDSPWAPWAMLAQADAFSEWGQPDNARLFYDEVIRVYPRSDAAKEARKLLAE